MRLPDFLGLLRNSIDVPQATTPAWIGNLATAFTGLDSLSDHLGNLCFTLRAEILQNGFSIKAKTIAERNRVFFFLDAHPNPKLILGDCLFSGYGHINNVTVW